jgi:diguanylate cyclase (GGDEF)-like protein/PAS domain S-box-containing protein
VDEDGVTLYTQVHMRDVRSRKRVEQYLTNFKQRYEAMFERAEYGFLLLDMDLNIVAANHQAAAILNWDLNKLSNKAIKEILKPGSFEQLQRDLDNLKESGELTPRQYRLVTPSGTTLWVEANIGLVDTNDDQPQYLQWVMRDITDQKNRETHLLNSLQEMETLAMTDPLTGLHNRRSIQRFGQIELEHCIQESKPFCVILIDVDGLKKINDNFGHHVGDLALSQCAQMLMRGKRREDAGGRWGGDEFLMVLPDTSMSDAEIVAHRIVKKINTVQVGQGSKSLPLAVSMGVAGLESMPIDDEPGFDQLVDLADQSMYLAKQKEGSQVSMA